MWVIFHRYTEIFEKKPLFFLKSFYKKSPTLPHLNSLLVVFEKAILNISSSIWCPSVPEIEKMSFFVTVHTTSLKIWIFYIICQFLICFTVGDITPSIIMAQIWFTAQKKALDICYSLIVDRKL